jgi:hypothetical protein
MMTEFELGGVDRRRLVTADGPPIRMLSSVIEVKEVSPKRPPHFSRIYCLRFEFL